MLLAQALSSGAAGTEYPAGSTIYTVGDAPSHTSTTCTKLVTEKFSLIQQNKHQFPNLTKCTKLQNLQVSYKFLPVKKVCRNLKQKWPQSAG